jgi:cellulose synthase/poly-beta-1,6-N-acetylglucosamine synthase-like glycosyltransferase
MRPLAALVRLGLSTVLAGMAVLTSYLLGLTVAAIRARPKPLPPAARTRHIAVLIPAHNEEMVIGRLLQSLSVVRYPPEARSVLVAADNCTDETAALARAAGAQVFERFDDSAPGKGFAIHWLLEQIWQGGHPYEAYVVLDADSLVEPDFLARLNERLEAGNQVIQAYYSVLNPTASPLAALRYAALAAVHYLRPLGRSALGLSCGLKGNGMCFTASVLQRFGWSWFALAEDVEFHLALVDAGIRTDFAPEILVRAEMPITYAQAKSQSDRWERGRLQMLRRRACGLFLRGLREPSLMRVDAALEQAIPPLSVPFAMGLLGLGAAVALRAHSAALLALYGLLGQTVYLLAGMVLVRAPLAMYGALAYAPPYIGWKVWQYGKALAARSPLRWIKTARTS